MQDQEVNVQEQEQEVVENAAITEEEIIKGISDYRNEIVKLAIDNNYNFDVIFNALSQVVSGMAFDYLLSTEGSVSLEALNDIADKFSTYTKTSIEISFNRLKQELEDKQAEEAEQAKQAEQEESDKNSQ